MPGKDCEPKKGGYEYDYLRICKYGIQKERCSDCLFDNLCSPEDKREDQDKWKDSKDEKAD